MIRNNCDEMIIEWLAMKFLIEIFCHPEIYFVTLVNSFERKHSDIRKKVLSDILFKSAVVM